MGAKLVVMCSPPTGELRKVGQQYFFEDPEVDEEVRTSTTSGTVVGFRKRKACCFRGIPFGKAKRNQAPVSVEPWTEERRCLRFGPACPQPGYGQLRIYSEGLKGIMLESMCGSGLSADKSSCQ